MAQKAINIEVGYPFAISVHSIPTTKDPKVRSIRGLVICHDAPTAIYEFVKATHETYSEPVAVELYIMNHKKAPDGVLEQDNERVCKWKVPVKKAPNIKNTKKEEDAEQKVP